MRRFSTFFYLFLIVVVSAVGGCQGCNDCEFGHGQTNQFSAQHVDNADTNPRLLASTDEQSVLATAYGIRLRDSAWYEHFELTPEAAEQGDFEHYDCFSSSNYLHFDFIKVVTRQPFDTFPAGSDVSSLFRARFAGGQLGPSTTYVKMDRLPVHLDQPTIGLLKDYHFDLLLTETVSASDTFWFSVYIRNTDRIDTTLQVLDLSPIFLR
jgi:hypothetical protein